MKIVIEGILMTIDTTRAMIAPWVHSGLSYLSYMHSKEHVGFHTSSTIVYNINNTDPSNDPKENTNNYYFIILISSS